MQFINFSNSGYASTTMLNYSPTSLSSTDPFLSDTGIAFSPRLEGNGGNIVSFSFWIKPQGSIGELIRWSRPTVINAELVRFNTTSALGASNGPSSGTYSTTISEALAPINEWYHVVFCVKTGASSTGKVMLYINGISFASEATHSNAFDIISSLNKIRFFERYSGKIGSIELWGTYLSQADAAALYAAGRTESPQNVLPSGKLMYSFPMLSSNVSLNSSTSSISNGDFELGNSGWSFVNTTDASTTGNMVNGNAVIAVSSASGISVGMRVTANVAGIQADTFVSSISALNITLSKAPTATVALATFTFASNKWVIGTADKYKGTNGLYVSSDGGSTSSYVNVTTRIYAYKDVVVPQNASVLKFRAKYPRDSADYVRCIISNTSFVPVSGTEYVPSASGSSITYLNANILKMGRRLNSSSGDGAPIAISSRTFKENYIDLSDYAGQTVRLIFCFVSDSAVSNAWGVAIDDISFVGKSKVTGTRYNYVSYCPDAYLMANHGGTSNRWQFGSADKYEGDNSLYITPWNSNTVTYSPTSLTVSHFYFDQVLDLSKPIFTFKAKIGGENLYDGLSVKIVDNTLNNAATPTGGSQYTSSTNTLATMSVTSLTGGIWKDFYIDLTSYINALLPGSYFRARIVFTWQNDTGTQTDTYSAAVDNIGFIGSTPVNSVSTEADFIVNSISFDDDTP